MLVNDGFDIGFSETSKVVVNLKLLWGVGGKWTTYRQMAEETVDMAICCGRLCPANKCVTRGLLLDGAHGWSPTLFIRLVQDFGVGSSVCFPG
jgi:glycerol-3-phosphate dehydrogenase